MNFGNAIAEKPTVLQQIKKLDEERAKILEVAKNDALARAQEAINELTALGFDYELAEPVQKTTRTPRKARRQKLPEAEPETPKVEPPQAEAPKPKPLFEYV